VPLWGNTVVDQDWTAYVVAVPHNGTWGDVSFNRGRFGAEMLWGEYGTLYRCDTYRVYFYPPGVLAPDWRPPPPLRADTDGNGTVSADDLFAYLNGWFVGDAACNRVAPAAVDADDLMAYLADWFEEVR
jgi:hypothetical protein